MNAVTQTNGKLQNKVSTLEVTNMDLLDQLQTTRSKVLQLELEVTKLKSKQSIVSSPEQIWVTPTRSIPTLSSTPRRSAPGKKVDIKLPPVTDKGDAERLMRRALEEGGYDAVRALKNVNSTCVCA